MQRVIILAGAPAAAALDWTVAEQSWPDEAGACGWRAFGKGDTESSTVPPPKWRVVSEQVKRMPLVRASVACLPEADEAAEAIETSHTFDDEPSTLSFRLPVALPASQHTQTCRSLDDYDDHAAFRKHSLAVHNELPSSLPDVSAWKIDGSIDTIHSLTLSSDPSTSIFLPPPLPLDCPCWHPLTRLAALPDAATLHGLAPQTITVHLVVAIVASVPRAPRRVATRGHRSTSASLLEIVVGDATKSGFCVSFWLPPPSSPASELESVLLGLCPQDVILLRHVALHAYGDRVYGSSLRKNQTKLHVLCHSRPSSHAPLSPPLFAAAHLAAAPRFTANNTIPTHPTATRDVAGLLLETALVHDWALRCVVVDTGGSQRSRRMAWDVQPEDTQESKCSKAKI